MFIWDIWELLNVFPQLCVKPMSSVVKICVYCWKQRPLILSEMQFIAYRFGHWLGTLLRNKDTNSFVLVRNVTNGLLSSKLEFCSGVRFSAVCLLGFGFLRSWLILLPLVFSQAIFSGCACLAGGFPSMTIPLTTCPKAAHTFFFFVFHRSLALLPYVSSVWGSGEQVEAEVGAVLGSV